MSSFKDSARVDFPAPLRPKIPTNSPCLIFSEIFFKTSCFVLKEGEKVTVKLVAIDEKGRLSLSIKKAK